MIKGLVTKSANYECQSITHNENSPATLSTVHKPLDIAPYDTYFKFNKTIIEEGVVVMTLATRCDGTVECFGREDENGCGNNNPYSITLIGTYFTLLVHFKFLLSSKSQKILKANNGQCTVYLYFIFFVQFFDFEIL